MPEQAVQVRDPFSQVHDALWDALDNFKPFTDLVREGNRVKLNTRDANPVKQTRSTVDAPEVRIEASGLVVNLFATSTSSFIDQLYSIEIQTDDLRMNNKLFPVQWAIIRAIAQLDLNLGLSFVSKVIIGDYELGENDDGAKGWQAVISVEVDMIFNRETEILG